MKFLVLGVIPVALSLVSCEPLSSGANEPLIDPGSGLDNADSNNGSPLLPGQFVSAKVPNTAFYRKKPRGSEAPDKLLRVDTNMKIVSDGVVYVKVELDSGEVGWVPSVKVSSSSSARAPMDHANHVNPTYPNGGDVKSLPRREESEQPPGGHIPTFIDPNAP